MKLIAISGKKRSGKNLVASIIQENSPLHVQQFAFADALKKELSVICGVTVEDIEQNKDLYRPLMQAWGVYQRKTKGEDYWVAIVLEKLKHSKCQVALVTDLRFKNEYKHMKYIGATMVRVERTMTDAADTHISETELDYHTFDIVIDNNGTLEQLKSTVKSIIK